MEEGLKRNLQHSSDGQNDKAHERSTDEKSDATCNMSNSHHNKSRNTLSDTGDHKRPRKKRKTFSCAVCRKFKTRCDFEPLIGKCHRCNVLQLDCSLTEEREDEILAAIEESSKSKLEIPGAPTTNGPVDSHLGALQSSASVNPLTKTLNNRLNRLEDGFNDIGKKLELVLVMLQGTMNSTSSSSLTSRKCNSASLKKNNFAIRGDDRGSDYSSSSQNNEEMNSDAVGEGNLVIGSSSVSPPPMSLKYASRFRRTSYSLSERSFKEPPLKLISDIDQRLFPREATSKQDEDAKRQRPFVVARVNFLRFYDDHKELCLKLSKEFLVRSHFWILPGGIKEVDDEYARKHVFITSVFTIIAMSFDDNDKYAEEQELLYPLVERLLTNTLTMFEKLIAQDIEAIMYCCMFHISRKAKRHRQLQFNSLVLSNFALTSLLSVFDFNKLKERVSAHDEYDPSDLYYLRILNSLTACKLEYAIGYGSFITLDESIRELNNLTAKFPQSNFGDDIKISEINLGDIVNMIFVNFETFFQSVKEEFINNLDKVGNQNGAKNNSILAFPELNYWTKNWKELLSKDGGGVLLFTFDFYHIMICRSFISEYLEEMRSVPTFLMCALNTMREHSFSLVKGFLRLPPSLIKGAPILTTHQLVYACLTLCDFLDWFPPSERQVVLNTCTRVYWHLNTIGEKKNEATDNVGKIIKSIIDTSKYRVNTAKTPSSLSSKEKYIVSTIPTLVEPFMSNSPQSNTHISPSDSTTTAGSFMMPDVDQFNSFEDFFQDFFENLKPTAQRMFATKSPQAQ